MEKQVVQVLKGDENNATFFPLLCYKVRDRMPLNHQLLLTSSCESEGEKYVFLLDKNRIFLRLKPHTIGKPCSQFTIKKTAFCCIRNEIKGGNKLV